MMLKLPGSLVFTVPCLCYLLVLVVAGSSTGKDVRLTLPEVSDLLLQLQESVTIQFENAARKLEETEIKLGIANAKLEAVSVELKSKLENVEWLKKNPVPLGFLYTQLPNELDPSIIWPTVGWTQVTHNYAGLFFRVEGGNSSGFGSRQLEQWPRLSQVDYSETKSGDYSPMTVKVPERGSSARLYTGANAHYSASQTTNIREFIQFHISGGEVRPVNTAIRLWKRTR